MANQSKKCKLKQCLNANKDGTCSNILPNIISLLIVDSITCPFYDDNFQKSFQYFKDHGGTLGAVARMRGHRTESELKEAKKAMRKTRSDKGEPKVGGKKRGRPKKEEPNTLEELF